MTIKYRPQYGKYNNQLATMFRTGGFEELEASVSPDGRFEITPVAA